MQLEIIILNKIVRLRKTHITHFLSFVDPRIHKDTQQHMCTYVKRVGVKLEEQRRLARKVRGEKGGSWW